MPLQDDPRWCPVKSFQVYLSLLHPEIDALWRQPQCTSYRDEKSPHYGPAKVGHNPLDTFVRRMSQLCNIELHYTNHCLRATRVTILKRANYSDKQIMSITGHQSHSSLNICNHVSGNEKMMMGYTIGYSLPNPSVIPMVQAENASIAPVEARRAMPQAVA
jgi:integrase